MSFRRIRRTPADQPKPVQVAPDGIVLQWKDSPPSPCLTIYVGELLGRELGIGGNIDRAIMFIGVGPDAGKCALQFVSGRDWDYRVQRHPLGYKVHLPSNVSVGNFDFCKRTAIPADAIEIRGDRLIFAYEGIKR
jgi:hypothetical protein